jgi:hypothetical protein
MDEGQWNMLVWALVVAILALIAAGAAIAYAIALDARVKRLEKGYPQPNPTLRTH